MRRLYIEGVDHSHNVQDIESLTLEVFYNEKNHTVERLLASDITLLNEAASMVKDAFFQGCGNVAKIIRVEYIDDCYGDMKFPMQIDAKGVKWCSSCRATVGLSNVDDDSVAYNRLDSDWYYGRDFLNETSISKRLAMVAYVDQPSILQYALRIVRDMLDRIFIIKIFFNSIIKRLDKIITGCGNAVYCPLISEILKYQCEEVGLIFQSSILSNPLSPYGNMAILSMESGNHLDLQAPVFVKDEVYYNQPPWTTIDLLDSLTELFGGTEVVDYRIDNGVLTFEHVDYFRSLDREVLIDVRELKDEGVDVCYSYINRKLCSFGDFKYGTDSVETEGNRVKDLYSDIMEFNDPYVWVQEGKCSIDNDFAPVRGMWDKLSTERTGFLDIDLGVDKFRGDNRFLNRTRDIILKAGATSKPKLLCLDGTRGEFGEWNVLRKPTGKQIVDLGTGRVDYYPEYAYNYPMYYDEDNTEQELVKLYLYRLNPRDENSSKFQIEDLKIPMTRERLEIIMTKGLNFKIKTELGDALAYKVILDFRKGVITVEDIQIYCS